MRAMMEVWVWLCVHLVTCVCRWSAPWKSCNWVKHECFPLACLLIAGKNVEIHKSISHSQADLDGHSLSQDDCTQVWHKILGAVLSCRECGGFFCFV